MGMDSLVEIIRKIKVGIFGCTPITINTKHELGRTPYCPFSYWYLEIENLKCKFLDKEKSEYGNRHIYYGCGKYEDK